LVKCATEICGIFATNTLLYKYYNNKEFAMAITQTFVFTRPNTTVDFHYRANTPEMTAASAVKQQYIDSGKMTTTTTVSDDELTLTLVSTSPDLEALGIRDTLVSLAIDAEFNNYITTHEHVVTSYTLTGIDAPFTCTTTYTFPTAGLDVHDILLTNISNDPRAAAKILGNPIISDTSMSVTHKYDNAADYTANFFTEFHLANELHAAGVTRTITYAMA